MHSNAAAWNRFPFAGVFRILSAVEREPEGKRGVVGRQNTKKGRLPRKRYAEVAIENVPSPDPRKPSMALDEARLRQQAIGVRLRQMFDDVVNEDVPDEFLDILRRADSRTGESG